MAKLQAFIFLALSLCHYSEQSIFSSLIRTNLNRYLKNPLFTKSIAPGWPGEQQEHGSSAFISPQNGPINEFIKSQNKFANEHLMEPYGSNYNFDLMALNNDFPGLMSAPHVPLGAMSSKQRPNAKLPVVPSATKPLPPMNGAETKNRVLPNNTMNYFDDNSGRQNSKSLTVSNSNVNAYSDTDKLQQFSNKNSNNYNDKKSNNTSRSSSSPSSNGKDVMSIGRFSQNMDPLGSNFENNLNNGNKYNQAKALSLKLEYGFKPLPKQQKPSSPDESDDFRKDFTVTNSIQMNDPFDFTKSSEDDLKTSDTHKEDSDGNESGNNIYSSIGSSIGSSSSSSSTSSSENSDQTRSMKSLSLDSLNSNLNNHLEEFAPDYKKYISYPMETESSDIHRLAFTGMESFKPDHSYIDSSLSIDHRLVDTLANYPNIKHFKSTGIDCARNSGYCEYDSSYPKEHVNSIISNCSYLIDDMYIEMPENLADFNGYKSFIEVGRVNSRQANTSLCDSERKYIRPSAIKDVEGHFYLILQSSYYFQQVPVEICSKPGLSCNVVGRCNSQVKCTQKYRTHMLISIDASPTGQPESHDFSSHSDGHSNSKSRHCPRMRMYRLPSSCVCELSRV